MKYYINVEKDRLLVDANDFTPYLAKRGYVEITKAEYDAKSAEHAAKERENDTPVRGK